MQLFIANKNYSSWSLRPWVLLKQLGIAFDERLVPFGGADFSSFSPSGRVPCLVDGDTTVWDSLAITEYLAERCGFILEQVRRHDGHHPGCNRPRHTCVYGMVRARSGSAHPGNLSRTRPT